MNVATAVLFLHVAAAATWRGAALWTPGDVRLTLALGQPHARALAARARPAILLDLWSGAATLVTGALAVGLEGGRPRAGIVVGLVAVLVRLGLGFGMLRPAWRQVAHAIAADDLAAARTSALRVTLYGRVAHGLWVVALAGMVFRW